MSAPCFGRPIWLVQLSLLEAPAVVRLRTPRLRISHSQSIFFFQIYSGRLRADRCLPGGIGAPEVCPSGGLFCYIFCLFHPVPALRHKIFVFDLSSQRNK